MRQDLIRKLCDPSIVKRYEMSHDCTGVTTDESFGNHNSRLVVVGDASIRQQEEQKPHETKTGRTCNFLLDPSAAMALTVTETFTPFEQNLSCRQSSQKSSLDNHVHEPDDAWISIPNTIRTEHDTSTNVVATSQPLVALLQYPSWNYLTLRHKQNTEWAKSQFESGVSYAKAALVDKSEKSQELAQKAEECYKKGLDMIPHHTRILTAYGALCINDGRYELAKELLQRAIRFLQQAKGGENFEGDLDADSHSDHAEDTLNDAKTYLTVVESKLYAKEQEHSWAHKKQSVQLSNRAEQAMKDVLAERAFTIGQESSRKKSRYDKNNNTSDYQLLSLSDSTSKESNKDDYCDSSHTETYNDNDGGGSTSRHSTHVHKHKRHKKDINKKRYDDRERGYESARRRRKRKRRKSRDYESSTSNDDDRSSLCSRSSDDSDNYRKQRRSRRKHRKKKKQRRRR